MNKTVIFKISDQIVVYFLQFWLLIDMLNGFLINNGIFLPVGLSSGEVTRIFFLLLLLFSLRIGNSKNDFLFIAVPYLLIVLSLIQYLIFDLDIIRNLNISTKLSLPILLYVFIKNNIHKKYSTLIKIVYLNSVVLILNLFISFLGFGFSNYGINAEGINLGGTGFFYAGNEVGGALLALYAILLYKARYSGSKAVIITVIFFIGALALLGKAPMLGIAILFIIYLLLYKPISKIKIIAIAATVLFLVYDIILEIIAPAINRWAYLIGEYGALTYMTGGSKRWEMAGSIFARLADYPLLIITGSGWSGFAEQNFVDLLEGFGLLGVIVFSVWIFWGVNIVKRLNDKANKYFVLAAYFLLITVAVFAGHIIQSAMIAPFIAIMANINFVNKHEKSFSYNKRLSI